MTRMQDKVWLFVATLLLTACGGETKKRDISEEPLRAGGLLEPISIVYNDSLPALSADGTRLVFVSGRQSTDAAAAVKVFRVDWPADGAPAAPVRLTTDELGYEREVAISPDGAWTAIKNAEVGRSDVYLQSYNGGAAVRVTDDAAAESAMAFSPDSKLLMWVSKGLDDAGQAFAVVKVVAIGTGAAADIAKVKDASASDAVVDTAFWAGMDGANYRLAVSAPSTAISGHSDITLLTFGAPDAAAAAARTAWRTGVLLGTKVPPLVVGDKAMFNDRVLPSKQQLVPRAGDLVEETPMASVAQAEILVGDVGVAPTALTPAAGFQTLATGLGTDFTPFALTVQAYRCAPDGGLITGAGVGLYPGGNAELKRVIPRLTADGQGFEVASDFCDKKRGDDSIGRIDDRLTDMVVNAGATEGVHRVVYVSQFSTAFNASCVLKVGDQELYGFDIKEGSKTVVPLSLNQAPLTSDGRGDQAACVL